MRAIALATLLFASSTLSSFAEDQGKPPISSPETVIAQPVPTDQSSQQSREQRTDRDRSRGDDREMGRDWRMHRGGDGDRVGRDDREMGPNMQRGDRDEYRDRDEGRGRYSDRDDRDRGWNHAYQDRNYQGYDEDRPRRRVKVCIEYENGDEYCRYRQGR